MSDAACDEAATGHRPARGILASLLARMMRRLEYGSLSVTLPNGQRLVARGAQDGPAGHVHLHRWRSLRRLLIGGDIGFAEAYIDGDWSSPDLTALIETAARNQTALPGVEGGALPSRLFHRIRHLIRANTLTGSRRNIMSHYDLGNDFYSLWLDPGMSYSSALFTKAAESLESAQTAKQNRVLDLLSIEQGQSVLEIGIGWGGLAERLIRAGGHVTGVTLSPSQLSYAAARLRASGLVADLHLQDYREIDGSFDRIVSIEMLEAVGEEWWPVFFQRLRERLAPGGVAVLQTITIADDRFAAYRRAADFIQRHVFPGGMLPAPSILNEQIARAGLMVDRVEMFGESYATTLKIWRERFEQAWPQIAELGFPPRFKRLWEYYLSYCEAGFRAGAIDVGLWRLSPQ
jgi:cyclopropane-fatty-acyl-phospholipid synthase